MAERVPERHVSSNKFDSNSEMSNFTSRPSNESNVASLSSPPKNESNDNSTHSRLFNGTKAQNEKAEWVVQDEPGVYVTLSSLPGGGNELRRVRFRYFNC